MAAKNYKILIAHPGRQHSSQAALALQKKGWLTAYWAGVPCLREHQGIIPQHLWEKRIRYSTVDLPIHLVKWNPVAPILKHATEWLPPRQAITFEYYGYQLFDQWAARLIGNLKNKTDAVIGYENACRFTFLKAKAQGIKTILDAAAIHYRVQDLAHHYPETLSFHRRITAIKDEELRLADHALVLSNFAKESYLNAGLSANRVHILPLGVDLSIFYPDGHRANGSFFTFLFSGKVTIHKGIDFLIKSFQEVLRRHPDVKLKLVGWPGDGYRLVKTANLPQIEWLGPMTQKELAKEYRTADCLVLPSRHDSYGMVVTEAMASGLPVIISNQVGAKDLVAEGKNGWVIPVGDIGSLTARMLWMVEHKAELGEMRILARQTAEKHSWDDYQKRLTDALKAILQ